MERIDEAVASVETMDIMTSILLEVILKLELFFHRQYLLRVYQLSDFKTWAVQPIVCESLKVKARLHEIVVTLSTCDLSIEKKKHLKYFPTDDDNFVWKDGNDGDNCDNDFSLKSYSDWCLSQKGSRLQTRNVQSKMREMVVNDQDKVGFNLNGNEDKICNKNRQKWHHRKHLCLIHK